MKHGLFLGVMCILLCSCVGKNVKTEVAMTDPVKPQELTIEQFPTVGSLCDSSDSEKRSIDIGECTLFCEIEGKGTPIVLINGGPGDTHHSFHPWLSALKDTFTVIYYDQRGCGASDYKPMEGYSFDQTVDDLENLRKALKYDKWIVLGFSYGGAIAQYYTIKYPESVLGQILVGAVPMMQNIPLQNRDKELFSDDDMKIFKEIDAMYALKKIDLKTMIYNKNLHGFWKKGTYFEPSRERLIAAMNHDAKYDPKFTSDYRIYKFDHVFETCPVPTLILEGKYELNWSSEKPALFKENHRNAEVVIIDNARHYIFRDQPEQFMKEIKRWGVALKKTDTGKITAWKKTAMSLLGDQLAPIAQNRSFLRIIEAKGVKEAVTYYHSFKKTNPGKVCFNEASINAVGYHRLMDEKIDEAIALFSLNVLEYPDSWNAFDSLAEAQLKKGNREDAIKNYKRSLELNPENANGQAVLKELEEKK